MRPRCLEIMAAMLRDPVDPSLSVSPQRIMVTECLWEDPMSCHHCECSGPTQFTWKESSNAMQDATLIVGFRTPARAYAAGQTAGCHKTAFERRWFHCCDIVVPEKYQCRLGTSQTLKRWKSILLLPFEQTKGVKPASSWLILIALYYAHDLLCWWLIHLESLCESPWDARWAVKLGGKERLPPSPCEVSLETASGCDMGWWDDIHGFMDGNER